MLSVVIGLSISILGLAGMIIWSGDMLIVLKGGAPMCFFLSGILAVIAGLSGIGFRSKNRTSQQEKEPSGPDKKQ